MGLAAERPQESQRRVPIAVRHLREQVLVMHDCVHDPLGSGGTVTCRVQDGRFTHDLEGVPKFVVQTAKCGFRTDNQELVEDWLSRL